jgi:3-hydroxyisobutyrate dehydrogenase-like beta-hydroxyacid dehydrogenase
MGDQLSVPLLMGSICINFMRQLRANGAGGDDLSSLARVIENAIDWQIRAPRNI